MDDRAAGAVAGSAELSLDLNHHGLNGAIRAAFPEAELYLCEWHLRHALERLMANMPLSTSPMDGLIEPD